MVRRRLFSGIESYRYRLHGTERGGRAQSPRTNVKRIVTIQDISCVGKCSLTVALPVISACGVECAVVPTAVLSTHTAFSGYTFHDLTGEMAPIAAHWRQEGFRFDAIYTGYLGSREQIDLVLGYFRDFGHRDNLIVVDPVMADNGRLYAGFTPDFPREMARLVAEADVIVPNLTEASFLLGIPYRTDRGEEELHELLRDLAGLGAKNVVLTGVSLRPGELGAMGYESGSGRFFYHASDYLPVSFHGTGDVFASTLVGALMRRPDLSAAVGVAVDYTVECLRATLRDPQHVTYGVHFEAAIPYLLGRLGIAEP